MPPTLVVEKPFWIEDQTLALMLSLRVASGLWTAVNQCSVVARVGLILPADWIWRSACTLTESEYVTHCVVRSGFGSTPSPALPGKPLLYTAV